MKKFRRLCLFLAACFTASYTLTGCLSLLPFSSSESESSKEESPVENSSSIENSSDLPCEDSSSSSEDSSDTPDPEDLSQWEIVDRAYELGVDEFLEGTYTLKGQVVSLDLSNKKKQITIAVSGREDKPILCYGITGTGVSSLSVGDIVSVRGQLTNYRGEHIEFFTGCQLLSVETGGNDSDDPYANTTEWEFYANYTPATSNADAYYRSLHGFLSGDIEVPDQAPVLAKNRPQSGGQYIRNSETLYSEDGKAYTVLDVNGDEAFTVYRNGAYVTLEEVAAFVYAFGTIPANYLKSDNADPDDSIFGEYLRLNHKEFSGNVKKYPYEPVLPNVSGCGGSLQYYEIDIGTTGTDCDPSYEIASYNDGKRIVRGAARIVYGKEDLNGNGKYELNEFHLFYTYNHYNDFQEYLNYEGGWGETFGNITGGGSLSSTTRYNPTDYVPVTLAPMPALARLLIEQDYKSQLVA